MGGSQHAREETHFTEGKIKDRRGLREKNTTWSLVRRVMGVVLLWWWTSHRGWYQQVKRIIVLLPAVTMSYKLSECHSSASETHYFPYYTWQERSDIPLKTRKKVTSYPGISGSVQFPSGFIIKQSLTSLLRAQLLMCAKSKKSLKARRVWEREGIIYGRWKLEDVGTSPLGAGPVDTDLILAWSSLIGGERKKTVSRATVCPIYDRSADLWLAGLFNGSVDSRDGLK